MGQATPFKHLVPRDLVANLKWRRKVLLRMAEDDEFAAAIYCACSKDPVFFLNAFGWTYDPRQFPAKRPFILYDFQEEALLKILDAINHHDLLVEKSRDMGASWLCVSAIFWYWMFKHDGSFLMVSRVEDYVDSKGNPKALFWKFDYLLNNLPPYLKPIGYRPSEHRRKLHIENPETRSVVDGESTTKEVARGDRRTVILLDEFAAVEQGHAVLSATRDATNCRLFNSTHQGTANAFFHMSERRIKKLRLHWSVHPLKSAGLYMTDIHGQLHVIDSDGYPDEYEPILDGKRRSPWYDDQCERAGSPQEIAQELDIDPVGSGHQYFDRDKVRTAINKYGRDPIHKGTLEYDQATGDPIRFREHSGGVLFLWRPIDGKGVISIQNKLVFAADVAAGTGASNSCLVGYDAILHEKVFEYASPRIRPEAFAVFTVALARFIRKITNITPFLIWEANGTGRQFGDKVLELGYTNIYLRIRDTSITKKVSNIPGWPPTKEAKLLLMGEYRAAIENLRVANYSIAALEETLEYIHTPNNSVAHARAANKVDPSGAGANHGDRAMADALAWKGIGAKLKPLKTSEDPSVPYGCLEWRRRKFEEAQRSKVDTLGAGW